MTRRLLVAFFAGGFCLADWLLDRLERSLRDSQEPFRRTVDDLLMGDYEPAPWTLEAP